MKKSDRVLLEILNRLYEHGDRFFRQQRLAESCGLSLGTVNPLIKKLTQYGGIRKKPQGFRIADVDRILAYWSVTRDLRKDIAHITYVPSRVPQIESSLPDDAIFTAYSGYTKRFEDSPADYSEVYVYANPRSIEKGFGERPLQNANLFVLEPDEHLRRVSTDGIVPIPQLYVDLWQLGRPADRFVRELEREMDRRVVRGLEEVAFRGR